MLSGFRVLDLTWVLGGPFAGQLLAQLGAEIIKVEPMEGDLSRQVSSHSTEFDGASGFFLSVNRGKKSISIDLKSDQGREVIYDLVRCSDAIIYGFAPAVPARLGLDPASLHKINPKIAIAQLIGLHDQPPYSNTPAFDLIIQAMSGVMSVTGEKDRPPVRVGYQIADLAGGMFLAMACLGAMLKALRSGKGDHIQISLLDCQLALLTWQAQNYFISGDVPKANGARHPVIAPSDIYPCADGNFIAISPTGQAFWKQFCSSIGKPELADDERFAHPKGRVAHVQELTAILTEAFQSRTAAEWGRHLLLDRVPASPVNDVKSALDQEIAVQRKMVESLQHPGGAGALNFLGNPFKFNGVEPLSWPPGHGEQTKEILTDLLGYGETRVAQLIANSIVYQGEKRNDKTK